MLNWFREMIFFVCPALLTHSIAYLSSYNIVETETLNHQTNSWTQLTQLTVQNMNIEYSIDKSNVYHSKHSI